MIVKLKGHIEFISEDFLDVDVQGVVFRVFISKKNIDKIENKDSMVTLHVYEIIKETDRLFFGFVNHKEREIFSDLLTVQGVGGKMAINIMSHLEVEEIINSISNANAKIFSSVSGVGNKLATRIINELKEKIKKIPFQNTPMSNTQNNTQLQDLVSCLQNLGYAYKVCESTANKVILENGEKKLEELRAA